MVVAASQNPPGVEPHAQSIPPGPPPGPGSRHAGLGPGSYRGPNPNHPDRQQQQPNWPFFYVQPSQPYMPYQWPMPMPYVPYGGFPGLGYGMVLPPFPPASYVDAPGYILPHTQLHVVDYRRMMNPHLAPTMAYQARRFRYQHTAPSGRVMVSSEVQTEPIGTDCPRHDRNSVTSSQSSSQSGRSTDSGSVLSPRPNEDKASACPEEGSMISSHKMAAETARIAATSSAQTGGILFQAEEVRIECSGSHSGLKIIRSKETTELASNADGAFLQCNMGSAEDVVLRCFQPVPFEQNEQCTEDLRHFDDPCPDILMGPCSSIGSVTTLDGSNVAPVEPVNSTLVVQGEPLVKSAEDICGNSKNIHFKVLRLPLDLQCLDELRQMESSVWSVESLMPYVPTTEWMVQNSLITPQKSSLATVMEVPPEGPPEPNQSPADVTPSSQENHQVGTVIELDGQDSMTSLESLPPYLPSASWLADFGNVYYSKISSNVQPQISDPGNWAKGQHGEKSTVNQDTEVQLSVSPNSAPEKLKEDITSQNIRISGVCFSDQESCSAPSCSDLPHKHKVRFCKSCSVKGKAGVGTGSLGLKSSCVKQLKVAQTSVVGDKVKVQLCTTCMHDPEKKARCKAAVTGSPGSVKVDNGTIEVSENTVYPSVGSKKCSKLYNVQNPYLGRHSEKCPMSHQSKLREQNCLCEDTKAPHSTPVWNGNGCGHHNDITWERNEENVALSATARWRDVEQRFISQQQGDKSWRGNMQVSDTESIKSGGRTRTRNKQKQCAQSLEIHRRDTRC